MLAGGGEEEGRRSEEEGRGGKIHDSLRSLLTRCQSLKSDIDEAAEGLEAVCAPSQESRLRYSETMLFRALAIMQYVLLNHKSPLFKMMRQLRQCLCGTILA